MRKLILAALIAAFLLPAYAQNFGTCTPSNAPVRIVCIDTVRSQLPGEITIGTRVQFFSEQSLYLGGPVAARQGEIAGYYFRWRADAPVEIEYIIRFERWQGIGTVANETALPRNRFEVI